MERLISQRGPAGSRLRLSLLGGFAVLFLAMILSLVFLRSDPSLGRASDFGDKLERCHGRVLAMWQRPMLDTMMIRDVYDICYNRVRSEEALRDWITRKADFEHQRLENDVILTMVVVITLSGIVLAGIQLYVSYLLAMRANAGSLPDSEVSFEQSKVSLRSSYVGVVVLFLSLAFFFIYIKFVYVLTPTDVPLDQPQGQVKRGPSGG